MGGKMALGEWWGHTREIQQHLGRLRPEDSEFKACLGYIVSLRPVWMT